MTTVVTDAGTDSKVAKVSCHMKAPPTYPPVCSPSKLPLPPPVQFHKRSIDIANVGSLEAIEYWSTSTHHFLNAHSQPLSAQSTRSMAYIDSASAAARANTIRASVDLSRLNVGLLFGLSSNNTNTTTTTTTNEGSGSVPAPMPSEGRGKTRKFFNNLFRPGKVVGAPLVSPGSSTADKAQSPVVSMFGSDITQQSPIPDAFYFGAPTFGTSPAVVGPHTGGGPLAGSRPIRYTWTIKRWSAAKGGGTNNGWTASHSSDPALPGEVILTWQRSKIAKRRQSQGDLKGERARRPDLDGIIDGNLSRKASVTTSDASASSVSANTPQTPALLSPGMADTHNRSADSRALSPRKSRPASVMTMSANEDEGDSDPEDSETPWTCSIRVPSGPSSWKSRHGTESTKWRTTCDGVMVATMYPAPHHPRVVAQFKLPLELPTLATGLTTSHGADSTAVEEIMLTEENIKDCLFVTALWLVAREEFSGLGRKK